MIWISNPRPWPCPVVSLWAIGWALKRVRTTIQGRDGFLADADFERTGESTADEDLPDVINPGSWWTGKRIRRFRSRSRPLSPGCERMLHKRSGRLCTIPDRHPSCGLSLTRKRSLHGHWCADQRVTCPGRTQRSSEERTLTGRMPNTGPLGHGQAKALPVVTRPRFYAQ